VAPTEGTPITIAKLTITNGVGGHFGGGGITAGNGFLTVRDAVVTGNEAPGGSTGIGPLSGEGGGIMSRGSLTVIDSAVTNNRASGVEGIISPIRNAPTSGSSGLGGGIHASGSLTLVRSTVSGNSVTGGDGADGTFASPQGAPGGNALGAGVYVDTPVTSTSVDIENTTISGNVAGPAGAGGATAAINGTPGAPGLARGGGISLDSSRTITATITNTTIAGNTAPSGANLGLRASPGTVTVTIRGTLLADPIDGANCEAGGGAITSTGFNLEDANPSTCSLTQPTDISGPDPGLLPLADNGGVGQTHAFSRGSPAVDAGMGFGLGVDQRGLTRPFGFGDVTDVAGGDSSDIGAFELHAPACDDGNDNDGDGKIDLADTGCADSADGDETDPPPAPKCAGRDTTIVATAGQPTVGTPGNDVILGTAGADTIRAGGGADIVCGGDGDDRLSGGSGKDSLLGESGNDRLAGGGGNDRLRGGGGNDRLNGGSGGKDVCGGQGGRRDRAAGSCERSAGVP
jgi:hypothetical protein